MGNSPLLEPAARAPAPGRREPVSLVELILNSSQYIGELDLRAGLGSVQEVLNGISGQERGLNLAGEPGDGGFLHFGVVVREDIVLAEGEMAGSKKLREFLSSSGSDSAQASGLGGSI